MKSRINRKLRVYTSESYSTKDWNVWLEQSDEYTVLLGSGKTKKQAISRAVAALEKAVTILQESP